MLHRNLCYFRPGAYSVVNMQKAGSIPKVGYVKPHRVTPGSLLTHNVWRRRLERVRVLHWHSPMLVIDADMMC